MGEWFVFEDGKSCGPFSTEHFKRLALEGKVTRYTSVKKGADGKWVPASKVSGLFPPEPQPQPEQTAATIDETAIVAMMATRTRDSVLHPPAIEMQPMMYQHQSLPPLPQAQPVMPEFLDPQAPQAYPQGYTQGCPQQYPQQYPQPQQYSQQYPQQIPQQSQSVVVHTHVHNVTQVVERRGEKKSAAMAIVLAFLFGPLGMLYSTPLGALVMFLVNLILLIPTAGLIVLITWPICCVWAALAANSS